MHYKNGRAAKAGDRVLNLETGAVGVLHSLQSQSTTCNGRLSPTTQNDALVTISKCLHLGDVMDADVADTSGKGTT